MMKIYKAKYGNGYETPEFESKEEIDEFIVKINNKRVIDGLKPVRFVIYEKNIGDVVNAPQHYNSGKYEVIDLLQEMIRDYNDPFVAHCVATAGKYMYRAPYKHDEPTECLKKAAKYLEFAIKSLEEK